MVRFTLFISVLLISLSCSRQSTPSEAFVDVDFTSFNSQIEARNDISNAESLIRLYYNYPSEEEGGNNIVVESKELKNNNHTIVLVHDRLMDDSQRGVKLVMNATYINSRWLVTSLKKNWKCWEGRGHTDWGIENCL